MTRGPLNGTCSGAVIEGTPRDDMRLRIAFREYGSFATAGDEDWDVRAKIPLDCLNLRSIDECAAAQAVTDPLLASGTSAVVCKGDACGECDCSARTFDPFFSQGGLWSHSDVMLTMSDRQVRYCVADDVLWLGGSDQTGAAKVSYKFRKKSCHGTPTPCEQRSLEECTTSPVCVVGRCRATTGDAAACADHYNRIDLCSRDPGCAWDPDVCTGVGKVECSSLECDVAPGCEWGPAERKCTGNVRPCEELELEECRSTAGCGTKLAFCAGGGAGPASCEVLDAQHCAKAPGCSWAGATCAGDTECSEQTDVETCAALPACDAVTACQGDVTVQCADLMVDQCHSIAGCSVTW